jgi:hypothetical protein
MIRPKYNGHGAMRRIAVALIIALLITATAEISLTDLVNANPLPTTKPIYAEISIQSLENTSSTSNMENAYGSSVQLSFNIKTNRFVESYSNYSDSHCFISLNSKSVEFKGLQIAGQTTVSDDNGYDPYTQLTLHGNASISNLATGTYTLEVKYAWPNNSYIIDYIVLSSASVLFSVESNITPTSEPIIEVPTIPSNPTSPNSPASTKTIIVPNDYHTIQSAIDSASEGDTIFVKSGNYNESVELNKSISLIGEDSKTTVITAPSGGVFNGQTPLKIFANNVKIFNLTINNYNVLGFGISIIGNATEIIGNTVHGQTAISTSASFTTISENNISGYYISVSIASSYCKITNNILSSDGIAVDLEGSSNLVSGNRITGHPTNNDTTGYGILINGNSNSVSSNLIEGEDDGIRVGSYESNNVVTANSIANCSDTGLRIDRWGFNNTCSRNDVTECKYGAGVSLGAYNNTIYQNNFVNNFQPAFASQPGVFNYWDNGKEGNYWSDFSTRYPNATETDSSGVWDTPYVINANNTDNYPLVMPYGTFAPQSDQEPFPTLLVVTVTLTMVVVVAVSLLVYFKKRKH